MRGPFTKGIMTQDFGYPVDTDRRCQGITKVANRCKKYTLVGRPFCALHGGEAAERRRASAENRPAVPPELLKEWEQFFLAGNLGSDTED